MIIVSIHLKSAITGRLSQLGCMTLANTGESDNRRMASYDCSVLRKPNFETVTRTTYIEDHRRLDKPIWDLVARALVQMGYGK